MRDFDSNMNPSQERVLGVFKQCAQEGLLRNIDWACANTFAQLSPDSSSAAVLMAVCLLSHMEGLGHTSLPLEILYQWPEALGSDSTLWRSLSALMPQHESDWTRALLESTLIRQDQHNWLESQEELMNPLPVIWERWSEVPSLSFRRHWISDFLVARSLLFRSRLPTPYRADQVKKILSLLFPVHQADIDWQQMACALSIRSGLTLVTGGPGTGKTYTVARILGLMFALQSQSNSLKVALAAPTGKAAARLLGSIQQAMGPIQAQLHGHFDIGPNVARLTQAHTLHSLLGANSDGSRFKFNAQHTLNLDVLIVDEASMVNLEMMSALIQALDDQTQLIFLGDPNQLAAVEAGSVLADLCQGRRENDQETSSCPYSTHVLEHLSSVMSLTDDCVQDLSRTSSAVLDLSDHIVNLKRSHRFAGPIASLAELIQSGEPKMVHKCLSEQVSNEEVLQSITCTHALGVADLSLSAPVDALPQGRPSFYSYLSLLCDLIQRPKPPKADLQSLSTAQWVKELLHEFERYRILCAVNEGPLGSKAINEALEDQVLSSFSLPQMGEWYAGRPIMVTHNQYDLGLSNGDIGLVLPERRGELALKAYFQSGDELRAYSLSRLIGVQTAFAMSIHKSQGSEYEHTVLVLPDHMDQALSKELLYTGVTRAKKYLTIVQEKEGLMVKAMSQVLKRNSGLPAQIKRLSEHLGQM